MNKYIGISEEELKNKIAVDYFSEYDCTKREDNIDFWVMLNDVPLLWAESKKGKNNITDAFIQLVLTIGKHQTNTKYTSPVWLAAFDATCISFIPYETVMEVFGANDFNWNVAPSNHQSKEFIQLKELIESSINSIQAKFYYETDSKELKKFIKKNIAAGIIGSKVKITKSSFVSVFCKWMEIVKPTISVIWDDFKRDGILPRDFYLADLLSKDGVGLIDNLSVLLNKDKYKLKFEKEVGGQHLFTEYTFNDGQKAYNEFWNKYERPPKKEYWEYIIKRADLLVPQDIRERKGSFFTPQIWVQKSQEYLEEYLGDNWQDEYYIWDCCAGTGNMEVGLCNKYKIWASTIDSSDVNIMRERIKNGASLLEDHVFQFDFLNDRFSKLPESLQKVINDPEKRKKLIIYINPPYAEAANKETVTGTGENKTNVAVKTDIYQKYSNKIGIAGRELFAQFLIRIYKEIPDAYIANFSTLKNLQGPNFEKFRNCFQAKLERLFVVPANTFDNVKGKFPIGFFIWNTRIKENFTEIVSDVYNSQGILIGKKNIAVTPDKTINDWLITTRNRLNEKKIAYMSSYGADFQHTSNNFIINDKSLLPHPRGTWITDKNLIESSIAFSARHCIEATWLNDRDQFLYPNDGWKTDKEFQTDCLIYTLFHNSNNIKSTDGINHWIPFYEEEVNAKDAFDSHFMADFIAGKIKNEPNDDMLIKDDNAYIFDGDLSFSDTAKEVLDNGKALWKYYHKQPKNNVNASFYEIREYFQGRDEKGKMNKISQDSNYNDLMNNMRGNIKLLAEKIALKVYQYGFLMR